MDAKRGLAVSQRLNVPQNTRKLADGPLKLEEPAVKNAGRLLTRAALRETLVSRAPEPQPSSLREAVAQKNRESRAISAAVGGIAHARQETANALAAATRSVAVEPEEGKSDSWSAIALGCGMVGCSPVSRAGFDVTQDEVMARARPLDVECADEEEDDVNPQMVTGYVDDIYAYLKRLEEAQPIRENYMKEYVLGVKARVNARMRAILVDWLIQVHLRFKLLQETLYLTVSILDLYLQTREVTKENLQLVGVTAMLVASKYEEMFCPEVADFVYITDRAYSAQQITVMEREILVRLGFRLGRPLPLHFLRRNSKAFGADAQMHTLAKYLMEVTLVDYSLCHCPPSLLAASALRLSHLVLEKEAEDEATATAWPHTMEWYSGYKEEQLRGTIKVMAKILLTVETSKHVAVYNKYRSSRFLKISLSSELDTSRLTRLVATGGNPAL